MWNWIIITKFWKIPWNYTSKKLCIMKSINVVPKTWYYAMLILMYVSYKTRLFNNVHLNLRKEAADVLLCQRELMRTSSFDVIAQMERLKGIWRLHDCKSLPWQNGEAWHKRFKSLKAGSSFCLYFSDFFPCAVHLTCLSS